MDWRKASLQLNTDWQRKLLLTSRVPNVTSAPLQVKCHGTGNFLKLVIKEKPGRSQYNPYSQVSISNVKVWGRLTGYPGLANRFVETSKDKTRIDKVLLEMGVAAEVLNWYDQTDVDYANMPIDENTKITLKDLDRIAQGFLDKEDFEGMKRITADIKKVVKLGRQIFGVQTDLEFAIAQQNYNKAIELKEQIQRLERERDVFDARYETSRYERMILLQNHSTMIPDDDGFNDSKLGNNSLTNFDDQPLPKPKDDVLLESSQDIKSPPRPIKTVKFNDQTLVKILEKPDTGREKDEKMKNQGDKDLEAYFKPKFIKSQGVLGELPPDILTRLQTMGLLDIFGYDVWRAYYSKNWQLRKAAAEAVLDFISMPLIARYIGRSQSLFMAVMEFCRLASEDKVLEIYLIGLKILKTGLRPPVCGEDIPVAIVNKMLASFSAILIKKIGEFNEKARDISLARLMEIFSYHPKKLSILIEACMDICEKQRDIIIFGRPQTIPIDKQQPRLIIARLEIIRYALENFGYAKDAPSWSYIEPFHLLLKPALFHPNFEVRAHAIDLALGMFLAIGEEIRQEVFSIDGLRQFIYEELRSRMEYLENDALGKNARVDQQLEEIAEDDDEEKKDEDGSDLANVKKASDDNKDDSKLGEKSNKDSKVSKAKPKPGAEEAEEKDN